MADVKALDVAKGILAKYQHDRTTCEKKLSCSDLVLLLCDLGLEKEVYARDGKCLLQSDLRQLYWQHHVDVVWCDPENSTTSDSDDSEATAANSEATAANSEATTADSEATTVDSETTTVDSEATNAEIDAADSDNSSLWDDTDDD